MSARWAAATVRARAATSRRLGTAAVRSLAQTPTWDDALIRLSAGPYGREVRPGQDLARAQHAVAAAFLWNVRVLAGWLPREGSDVLRVISGWAEIANVDQLLRRQHGQVVDTPAYRLGSLATAWPRLSDTTEPARLRTELARSAWTDPGGDHDRAIQLGMRLALAARVASAAPGIRRWTDGAAALVLARALTDGGPVASVPPGLVSRSLGLAAARAVAAGTDLPGLAATLGPSARWALVDVASMEDLWEAEARWWRTVDDEARAMTRTSGFDLTPVLGAVGVLAVDAWRVRAALELAARGGTPVEVFDAVV
jgi:hypothetical protein